MRTKGLRIEVERREAETCAVMLRLVGQLDGETYDALVMVAQHLHAEGVRHMTLALARLQGISGAGGAALQHIADLLEGRTPADLEQGWEAIHAIVRHRHPMGEARLRMIHAQPGVQQVVMQAGMEALL
jgi:hypothetical protein